MPPLRDLITDPGLDLTPSERKVVRALLDQYPRNGLGPMARLAEHAGVSDPTIVRLVKKLGFGGYAEFQEALLSDMDHRLRSPRTLLQPRSQQNKDDAWAHYLADSQRLLVDTQALTQPEDVRILVEWLLDSRHQVYCFGGRFSILLANYLLNHLRLLRPGCFALEDNALLPDRLFDLQRQEDIDYAVGNWYVSTHPESPFTQRLMVARTGEGWRKTLNNGSFAIHRMGASSERREVADVDELMKLLRREFDLQVPDSPRVRQALARVIAPASI